LVELWNAGQGIDLITFTQVLRDRSQLDAVGGAAFVTSLFTFVPTAANVGHYIDIIRDKYESRRWIQIGTEIARLGKEGCEPSEILAFTEGELPMLRSSRERRIRFLFAVRIARFSS
jgi:replicative DNA helicase